MIYIDNNEETQVVFIPRGAVKIGVTPPVSEESLSDYYTKNQVNSLLQHYPTKSEVQGLIPDVDMSGYQEKLVSSENIKTVNGVSLLGSGNVNVKVPHFVFTLDMENGKANLVEGDASHLLHLVTTSGQFTAELTFGDACVNYLTVYKGENGTASITFDAQDTYLSVILADEGVPYTDMPVQYVDKKTVLGITGILAEKQDKLVSGTSIKTINGESLLGSGDITIEGGTVDADSLEQAIMDSPYISAILARVENLEDRVDEIEENNNNMVSEL